MKILTVFAHPDDESYGPAGTIAHYAGQGADIYLITLTRGESGKLGPCKELPANEVAELRTKELHCATTELGITRLIIGHFADGKLNETPDEEGVTFIQSELQKINPDVVITFRDKGITGHPDHIVVSKWVTEVVKNRKLPTRLFYFGISEKQANQIEHRKMYAIPEEEITHQIDVSAYLEQKKNAIRCHASQIEIFEKQQQLKGGFDQFHRVEFFSQIFPEEESGSRKNSLI